MGGPTVGGAHTGREGVEPARLSAGAAAASSLARDAPQGLPPPDTPHPVVPRGTTASLGRTRGQVRRLPRYAPCPLYWVPVRGY
jgi:hypothetical protein